MGARNESTGMVPRLLATASLVTGLGDAARLLGLGTGAASPILMLGEEGFALLSVLCVTRLFAAVGLWIGMRWGAVLLVVALAVELGLYVSGSSWVSLTLMGFLIKLALMVVAITALGLSWLFVRRRAAD